MSSVTAKEKTRRKWPAFALGVAVSIFCIGFMFHRVNLIELGLAFSHFKWPWAAAGIFSLAFGYTMRMWRWAWMLQACGAEVSALACAPPFLGSIALNNVFPFRAGDVVRALVFPQALSLTRTIAIASLVLERMIDLVSLLLCLGIGLALSPELSLPVWLKETVVTLSVLGGFSLMILVIFSRPVARMIAHFVSRVHSHGHGKLTKYLGLLQQFVGALSIMSRPAVLSGMIFLSFFVWGGEAGLFYAFLAGFGLKATMAAALLTMGIATLSTLAPSSPGYVGPFHLAAFVAITMLGGNPAEAASFALLTHAALWISTTLAGSIAILMNPRLFRGADPTRPETSSNDRAI